jgi:hypothetical protein
MKSYYTLRRYPLIPGLLHFLKLNPNTIDTTGEMYYILTPPYRHMKSGFYSYVPVSIESAKWLSMTYETYEAQLLAPPFETECVDYRSRGYESRGDCFESCLRKEIINRTNSILPGINIQENDTHPIIPLIRYLENKTRIMIKTTDKLCNSRCAAKDCLSIVHIPRKLSSIKKTDVTTLATIAPQTPVIKATCQSAFTLTNYLTNLVATFGFWLGVSALGLFRFIRRSVKAIKNACCPKENEVEKLKSVSSTSKRSHYRERHPTPNFFKTENSYDYMIYDFLIGYRNRSVKK